jgi:hypothetical protein
MTLIIDRNRTQSPGLSEALFEINELITQRIQSHFNGGGFDLEDRYALSNNDWRGKVAQLVPEGLTDKEWVILLVALIPHVQPNFFESIILEHLQGGGDFPEFGGVKAVNHRSMLPTGETVQFILAGTDVAERLTIHHYFSEDHFFCKQNILWLESVKEGEPLMSGRIILNHEWVDRLLFDRETPPRFGADFPARKITTNMLWEDAVLHPQTLQQVNDLAVWLQYHHRLALDENLGRKVKPGYRVLFYGPPGTGKTLTAALLGKQFCKDVYRVDLSQIVSKYIGETEKNLEGVFKRAESKDWILFFDEADALFGKRTNVQSAHDKYANQEVSYLLQRVEDYAGLLILASNFKNNLDEAFVRRFHSVVHFPLPNVGERLQLWRKAMPANLAYDSSINLDELARKYEMTGAAILNAVQFSTLLVYARNDNTITQRDLIEGIRKEYMKEEKSI